MGRAGVRKLRGDDLPALSAVNAGAEKRRGKKDRRGRERRYRRHRARRERAQRPERRPTVPKTVPNFAQEPKRPRNSADSLAERGGFEPPKPFWSLHALQACALNRARPPLRACGASMPSQGELPPQPGLCARLRERGAHSLAETFLTARTSSTGVRSPVQLIRRRPFNGSNSKPSCRYKLLILAVA